MSQLKVNSIVDAAGGSSAVLYGVASPPNSMGFRNRLINSDMRIDQRNAGASVTVNSGGDFYAVDRWPASGESADGVFTVQRSSIAPAGFTNSLLATVTTADASIGATQRYFVEQKIEGFNVADLGFGSANAQTVTLSFWVRSSVTGTFGGTLANGSNRYYPFSYTINAANTFEQKTITIAGDTTGTWNTGNGMGIELLFSLGCGSSRKGTAGAWTSSVFLAPTGSADLIATNGATFFITGVQLEAGTVATPFERRDYGRELIMCQRYFQRLDMNDGAGLVGMAGSSTFGLVQYPLPVVMRAAPSALGTTGVASDYRFRYGGATFSLASAVPAIASATTSLVRIDTNVASGLTAGNVVVLSGAAASSVFLTFSAEL